ncbi:FMN-binding split barrel, partial [Penicillium cinerascens]
MATSQVSSIANSKTKPANGVSDRSWHFGDGATATTSEKKCIEIDPYGLGRTIAANYKLMISGFVPRPISLLSTQSKDGTSSNLAPFSYSQMVNVDPPIFIVGFTTPDSGGHKDSLRNLLESGECVINIVSENFVEAANACSLDAPYGKSEWAWSGLTKAASTTVGPSRVKESIFSIEGKLSRTVDFDSRITPGSTSGTMAIIEGTRFWVREDALDERNCIDLDVLKPISRLGGITYGKTVVARTISRPRWEEAQ